MALEAWACNACVSGLEIKAHMSGLQSPN